MTAAYTKSLIATMPSLGPHGVSLGSLPVLWSYRADDPYAVELAFPRADVHWILSRDDIAAAVTSTAVIGAGDVRLATRATAAGDITVLTLHTDYAADLVFLTHEIVDFLACSEDITALGQEHFNDGALEELLDRENGSSHG